MPPHYWIPMRSSSCKQREGQLRKALGAGNVIAVWKSKKKARCYAIVCGSLDDLPDFVDGEPIELMDDELGPAD